MDPTWMIPDLPLPEDPSDPCLVLITPPIVRFIMAAFCFSPELMSCTAFFPSCRCMYTSKASTIMAMARPVSVTMNTPPREWSVMPAMEFHLVEIRFREIFFRIPQKSLS